MRKANLLTNYKTSGEYKPLSNKWRESNNVLPHEVWQSKDTASHNQGLLIAKKKKQHWAVSVSAVERINRAEEEDRIDRGYLVMEYDDVVIAVYTIKEVIGATRNVKPNPGSSEWGPYHFLDEELNVRQPGDFNDNDNL
jgi:hypothetical protein